jgi:superfamily I DNA/RNA helicase
LRAFGVEDPEKTRSYRILKEKIDIIVDYILPSVVDVSQAITLLEKIFSDKKDDQKNIVLSTIHKAKGSEADRVFVLRRDLMPSKFAKQDWELQQEINLQYVCYTRAKKELVFITDIKND